MSEPLRVKSACHAQLGFDVAPPRGAQLFIEHLCDGQLLARECRPLSAGDAAVQIRTHPEASHIRCTLKAADQVINGVCFNVECGQRIEPAARHFIVIGAMKAGTTTLFELLAKHPAICSAWGDQPGVSFTKEVDYFRKQYRDGDSPLHYDWRFPFDPAKHAWTLDVSPNYAKWPGSRKVPARIGSLEGETRLAYILREPVDRIESHVAHMLLHHGEIRNLNHCIRTSRYAMQLDRFIAHMDRDRILLLDFEKLRRNPRAILKQVCDFLSVERVAIKSKIHNTRSVDFQFDARERVEMTEAVRPDVRRLISEYGFRPAETWLRRAT